MCRRIASITFSPFKGKREEKGEGEKRGKSPPRLQFISLRARKVCGRGKGKEGAGGGGMGV